MLFRGNLFFIGLDGFTWRKCDTEGGKFFYTLGRILHMTEELLILDFKDREICFFWKTLIYMYQVSYNFEAKFWEKKQFLTM